MKLNPTKLQSAFSLAQETLETQNLPAYMKNRWSRALEKAKEKLVEQPFFAWQTDCLTVVSIPKEKGDDVFSRFYQANEESCRRIDKLGYCPAFYEGFPCWHRSAFLLLRIYFGISEKSGTKIKPTSLNENSVN